MILLGDIAFNSLGICPLLGHGSRSTFTIQLDISLKVPPFLPHGKPWGSIGRLCLRNTGYLDGRDPQILQVEGAKLPGKRNAIILVKL